MTSTKTKCRSSLHLLCLPLIFSSINNETVVTRLINPACGRHRHPSWLRALHQQQLRLNHPI